MKAANHQEFTPVALMRAMGSRKGFDPMPPDQHAWHSDGTPLQKLWAWMCDKTIRRGHRSPYAVTTAGKPLSLKDAASDLDLDEANVHRAWREGLIKGLWRTGEGRHLRRLYLCGEVVPLSEGGEEKEQAIVCTDNWPPYIAKQIKELDPERRAAFISEYTRYECLRKSIHADVVAGIRIIMDTREDNLFRAFGIEKIREEHKLSGPKADQKAARDRRVDALLFDLERFVQTASAESVQSQNSGSVQTTASLLSFPEVSLRGNSSSSAATAPAPQISTTTTPPIALPQTAAAAARATVSPREGEFRDQVETVFAGSGRGVPTARQIAEAFALFPADADPNDFGQYLGFKLPKLRHAGSIVAVAREYATEWRKRPAPAAAPDLSTPFSAQPDLASPDEFDARHALWDRISERHRTEEGYDLQAIAEDPELDAEGRRLAQMRIVRTHFRFSREGL